MQKSTIVTIILILVILLFGGLSLLIATKLNNVKSVVAPKKTKAADLAYSKIITLETTEAESTPSPTLVAQISPTKTPTPTQIQLLTTPIVTSELLPTPTTIISPTRTLLTELPQTSFYSIPLVIFFTSLGLIALAFIL